jgi:hypothetical protein
MATQSLLQIYDTATKQYRSLTTDDLASIGGGGGGGDASAENQLTEIARLEAIRDRLPATGALSDVQLRAAPVSVSATALPLPTGAATAADQTNGTQRTQLTDGTNNVDVTNTAPSATAQGLVVRAIIVEECPTFIVSTGSQALPAVNGSLLSIALATPSTVTRLRLRDLYIRNLQSTNIAGVIAAFELRRFTTHSAGTVLTVGTQDSSDVLSSDVTVRRAATIAGEVAESPHPPWYFSTDEHAVGGVEIESTQALVAQLKSGAINASKGLRLPTIRPGEGLHIKLITNAGPAAQFEVSAIFTQE